MPSRSQRYRLIHEFVLRDRGDYATVKRRLMEALASVDARTIGFTPDYLAIEKVEDDVIVTRSLK